MIWGLRRCSPYSNNVIFKLMKNLVVFLCCALMAAACSTRAQRPTFEKEKPTIFSLRNDGVILKNNAPFFPMGFYIDRGTTESYINAVKGMSKNADFNIVNLPYNRDTANWQTFLDVCAENGVYVVSQLYYDDLFYGQVELFKDHVAMYGWSVADDADNGHFSQEQLRARNKKVKEIDPDHLSETSLTGYYQKRRDLATEFTAIADVSCFQSYPITPLPDYGVKAENALTASFQRTKHYVKSASVHNKPMILNTQTFSWIENDPELDARYPTAEEIRNMIYSSLSAGIKGIISYTYSAIHTQEKQWSEMKNICNDIKILEPALLNGKHQLMDTGDDELVQSYWVLNNKCYLVTVNTSYTNLKKVAIDLPGKPSGFKPLFNRFPTSLSLKEGKVSGILGPEQVQVYVMDLDQSI